MPALVVAPAEGFDSYVSEAFADAYMASVNHASWTGTEDEKRGWLRRGAQFVGSYRLLADAVDPVVHPNVKAAQCEAAIRAKAGTLYRDTPAQAVKAVTVGPIKREFVDPRPGVRDSIPIIDDLLEGLTIKGFRGGTIYLERA